MSESPSIDEKFGLVFGVRKIKYNKFNHKYKDQIHAKKNTRMTHMIVWQIKNNPMLSIICSNFCHFANWPFCYFYIPSLRKYVFRRMFEKKTLASKNPSIERKPCQ